MVAKPSEELAPRSEDEVREHLKSGKLVEGLQHMSPSYLEGLRRILTVSADTELVSAPSYLRAAQHAPALNNFGSAMSIVQDELAHAHIGYRLLGRPRRRHGLADLRAARRRVQVPVRVRRGAGLVGRARVRERALRPGRLRAALRRPPVEHVRAVEARAGEGRQGGDLPPAPRPHLAQEARQGPGWQGRGAGRGRLDVHPHARVVRAAGRAQAPRDPARVRLQGQVQRPAAPGPGWPRSCRSWTRSGSACPAHWDGERWSHRLRVPARVRRGGQAWGDEIRWDDVHRALEGARADERAVRREAAARLSHHELPRAGR